MRHFDSKQAIEFQASNFGIHITKIGFDEKMKKYGNLVAHKDGYAVFSTKFTNIENRSWGVSFCLTEVVSFKTERMGITVHLTGGRRVEGLNIEHGEFFEFLKENGWQG
jgi:hypothetical protein